MMHIYWGRCRCSTGADGGAGLGPTEESHFIGVEGGEDISVHKLNYEK